MSVLALTVDVELAYNGTLLRVSFLPAFTELLADVEADDVAAVEVVADVAVFDVESVDVVVEPKMLLLKIILVSTLPLIPLILPVELFCQMSQERLFELLHCASQMLYDFLSVA